MSASLDDLDPDFKPLAMALIAYAAEAHVPVMIINTLRSATEQQHNLTIGVSWTKNSKHLPNFRGKSEAIDLCPYSQFVLRQASKLQWDGNDPVWKVLGAIGKTLGLRWGGDWAEVDLGHFELVRPPATKNA